MAEGKSDPDVGKEVSLAAPPRDPTRERQLLAAALAGNRRAFGELALLHQSQALVLATNILGDREEARDLVQESFLKAWAALGRFQPGRPFLPWFLRILRNACIQQLRRRLVRRTQPLEGRGEEEGTVRAREDPRIPRPEDLLHQDEIGQVLGAALERLPSADREILILKEYQRLSYRQIADLLGIPPGTVMSRLSTARRRLRALLPKEI